MVSEVVCVKLLKSMLGATTAVTESAAANLMLREGERREKNSLVEAELIRPLLAEHELAVIEASIRWLYLGEYVGKTTWGIRGPWAHTLTEKGIAAAKAGAIPEADRKFLYQVEPYQVFLAHQFREEIDGALERGIREALTTAGYSVVDGKVEGLEPFRHAILEKIRKSRFFLCLLTHRARLESGAGVSSVWLYQEIGAAVAMKKSPLLFVEDGMDAHYAGELQKIYEYESFSRAGAAPPWDRAVARFNADLSKSGVPLPVARK